MFFNSRLDTVEAPHPVNVTPLVITMHKISVATLCIIFLQLVTQGLPGLSGGIGAAGSPLLGSLSSSTRRKPDAPLGTDCAVCEDVVTTYKGTFPCRSDDVGDGESNTDQATDVNCGFSCSKSICHPEDRDPKSCQLRKKMCEAGQKGIAKSKSLYIHIWQTLTCEADVVDVCARLSSSMQYSLGFAPICTEEDWNILTSEECKDNMHCDKTRGGEVSDSCFTCMWLFKTSPLFAGQCEPTSIKPCLDFSKSVAESEPVAGELYLDDVPDPWTQPPWAAIGPPMRRRRRLLETKQGAPFSSQDKPGMGSPKLYPLPSSSSWPGDCFKLWREISVSTSAQELIQRIDDPVRVCKCTCKCPYDSLEWLGGLAQSCNEVIDPEGYEYEIDDVIGRECKEKKEEDQKKFADEAAAAGGEAGEESKLNAKSGTKK